MILCSRFCFTVFSVLSLDEAHRVVTSNPSYPSGSAGLNRESEARAVCSLTPSHHYPPAGCLTSGRGRMVMSLIVSLKIADLGATFKFP